MTETILITKEDLLIAISAALRQGAKHRWVLHLDSHEIMEVAEDCYNQIEKQIKKEGMEVTDGQQN